MLIVSFEQFITAIEIGGRVNLRLSYLMYVTFHTTKFCSRFTFTYKFAGLHIYIDKYYISTVLFLRSCTKKHVLAFFVCQYASSLSTIFCLYVILWCTYIIITVPYELKTKSTEASKSVVTEQLQRQRAPSVKPHRSFFTDNRGETNKMILPLAERRPRH